MDEKYERGAPLFRYFYFEIRCPASNAVSRRKAHIETAATSEAGKNKPPVKKMEPKPVQTYSSKELRYDMNEQLDQVVVTVVDPSTNKVIKEIPSAEVQEMRIRVKDAIGSFIDETR